MIELVEMSCIMRNAMRDARQL
ncbi:hypothetical protein NOCA2320006 [metagenome]|uniref:Uncharacterized protein n=1 Tax=metagenome TaxID=256318 RepID=A0A2P2C2K2_9ZZZZ